MTSLHELAERRPAGPPPLVVFLLAAAVLLLHTGGYGMTFDEARIMDDAHAFIAWIGGVAGTREVWFGLERPSPAKILAAAGLILFDRIDPLVAIRIFPALLYAFAATFLYAATRRPRGAFAAASAAAAMILAPPLFALAAQASNESVVSSLTLIGLFLAATARTPRAWGLVGVVAGVAVGTKVTGLVLVAAVPAWALFSQRDRLSFKGGMAFLVALAAGFLATWPPLLLHPRGLLEHLAIFAKMERPPLLYFGLAHAAAPWHYAPVWILLGVPPFLLLFAFLGLLGRRRPLATLLAVYLGIACAAAIAAHSVLREGVRHLMPVVVVLAAVSGLGLGQVEAAMPRRRLFLLLLFFAPFLLFVGRHYPADAYYVSEVIGGHSGAARRGLPITSSGDLMNDDLLARLPAGRYAVLPGPAADRPINFASPRWRVQLGERAIRVTGRPIVFTTGELADQFVILGAESPPGTAIHRAGLPLVARGGAVQAALVRNPSRRSD